MRRIAITIAVIAAGAIAAPAAQAAYHAGCDSRLEANQFEFCHALGNYRHFQLTGTGKFTIQLPYGSRVTAHYVGYRNWQAYVTMPSAHYGRPGVMNVGCCNEDFSNGWVW